MAVSVRTRNGFARQYALQYVVIASETRAAAVDAFRAVTP